MAFPDYGPLPEISQFTQDGFLQGSFLFSLFAGEVDNTLALHYVGLTFALIGALAIIFMKKFHNITTIGAWTFLLIILLIGPKGASINASTGERASNVFFTSVPTNTNKNPSGMSYANAFTPQALAIDIMSKIHKAIYVGFFDISDPTNPRTRNLVEDLTTQQTNSRDGSLNERPDIKVEISAYTHFCGKPSNLPLPIYNELYTTNINTVNEELKDAGLPSKLKLGLYQLDKETTYALQKRLFRASSLPDFMTQYTAAYSNQPGQFYPPFAIAYQEYSDLEKVMENSGLPNDLVKTFMTFGFDENDGEELADSENDFFDFLTTKERLIDSIGGTLKPIGSSAITKETPAFAAFIEDNDALSDIDKGKSPRTGERFKDADPIEKRLNKVLEASIIPREKGLIKDDPWVNVVDEGGRHATPISLGFITPNLKEVYQSRIHEADDRLSNLADKPILNVVSSCSQLHQLIHSHVRDALVYQKMWPTHGGAPTSGIALTQSFGLQLMAIGTNKNEYLSYPYPPADNLSSAQESINQLVQTNALALSYNDPTSNEFKNLLNPGHDPLVRLYASESLRKSLLASTIESGINNSSIMYSMTSNEGAAARKVRNELTNQSGDLADSMRFQASGASIVKSMPSIGSGLFQDFANIVADIGLKISAQFEGIGAIAYIRFLQLMISIALFFIIMCTPILYMMGVLVPAHAPGVIATSILGIVALKAIPIGFTLVDAIMSNAMSSYDILNFNETDLALMLYVTATAYTSITMVTLFLLFKAGDTQSVIGQMAALDNKANEIADQAATVVKGLAVAAGAAVTAGVGGAIGGGIAAKAAGAGAKGMLKQGATTALTQSGEVFGKRGLQSIPGAGGFAGEILNSYREGKGQGTVMTEIDKNNLDIDRKVAEIDKELANPNLDANRRASLESERKRELSERKSYNEHMQGYADAQAEDKYRSRVQAARKNWAADNAEDGFKKSAESQGMTNYEARRKAMNAEASAGLNSTLGSAVTAQKLEMQGDVQIGDANISPQAAQSIAQGMGKANLITSQGSPERIAALEKSALNKEMDAGTNDILNNQVDGPGRKPIFKPFDRVMTDKNGDPLLDKDGQPIKETVTQDPLYDQGASEVKSKIRKDPELKHVDSATFTKVTERVAAEELAKHYKGELKMNLDSRASDILGYENLTQRASSGKAKDLWVTPNQQGYEELRKITGTGEGEAVSLFNMHMARSNSVATRAKNLAKEHQEKLDDAEKSVGLKQRNS
ncbi:MAG: hypothetical protein CMF61_03515 [Magnetococcales bacterium]|nr:hypothetical protein [Magnetococcales bacterium]